MRSSPIGLVTLLLIGLVLLPTDTNIASSVLPDSWKPYLWLAWPVAILLAGILIHAEMRDRRQRRPPPEEDHHPVTDEQQKQLGQAGNDLAEAVRRQWTAEAKLRSLHNSKPLRVSWRSIPWPAGADLSRVVIKDRIPGRPLEVRGNIQHLLNMYQNVRSHQLVLLGAPAAGKSMMALALTLALLPEEHVDLPPRNTIPVLVTVSSWNPRKEKSLHDWLARRIVEEYPALANAAVYGPDAAMQLITRKRVVPVLDGLDEMPRELQPTAIEAIIQAVSDEYPLVVTCRSAEYNEAVDGGKRLFPHAAVLEIQPLNIDDAEKYLGETDPHPERWKPVFERMRNDHDEPLKQALRSPLMVDLARVVYGTSTENPAQLLDFPSRSDVERHLLKAFLRVRYEVPPISPDSDPSPPYRRYPAERADRWLRFLAKNLSTPEATAQEMTDAASQDTPDVTARDISDATNQDSVGTDLVWWQLIHLVPRPVLGAVATLLAGLVSGLAMGFSLGPTVGLAYALTWGPAAGFSYLYGQPSKPMRIQVRFRGHGRSLLWRLAASLASGLATGHAITGSAVMLVLTVQLWLDTPPDTATAASPMDVLKHDRRAALSLGGVLCLAICPSAAVGFMCGVADFPIPLGDRTVPIVVAVLTGAISSALIGSVLGYALMGRTCAIAFGIASAAVSVPIAISASVMEVSYNKILPPDPGLAAGLSFGLLLGWMAAMTRSWGAFGPARAWFALRGDLPWGLMRFLDDAHSRGVLRQAGTVYQFRHERLRDHLAEANKPDAAPQGDASTTPQTSLSRPAER